MQTSTSLHWRAVSRVAAATLRPPLARQYSTSQPSKFRHSVVLGTAAGRTSVGVMGELFDVDAKLEVPGLYAAVKAARPRPVDQSAAPLLRRYDLGGRHKWMIGAGPLIVRRETERFYAQIEPTLLECESRPRAVDRPELRSLIIGNPGLGKSWALCYFLWRALQRGKLSVYLKRGPNTWFFDHHTETAFLFDSLTAVTKDPFLALLRARNQPTDVLYLHDVYNGDKPLMVSHVPTVAATSPAEDNYKEYLKQLRARELYAAPWTLEELKAARPVLFPKLSEAAVATRYNEVGGVPRVLAYDPTEYERYLQRLRNALNEMSIERLQALATDANSASTGMSSKLLYVVDAGTARLLSRSIVEQVMKIAIRRSDLSVMTLTAVLDRLVGPWSSLPPSIQGPFFEGMFHLRMSGGAYLDFGRRAKRIGGPSAACAIPAISAASHPDDCTYGSLMKVTAVQFISALEQQQPQALVAGRYYRPSTDSFPLIDGFLCVQPPTRGGANDAVIVAFQLTVAKQRKEVSRSSVLRLIRVFRDTFGVDITKCSFQVVFVVPHGASLAEQVLEKDSDRAPVAEAFWGRLPQFVYAVPLGWKEPRLSLD